MSATSVWDAPSGECLRGRGRYGVVCRYVTLCDPYLSALSVSYFNKGAIYKSASFTFSFFLLTPSDNTGAIAASLARRRPTCPQLTPARPCDARSSGTALVASPAEHRVQSVFTGSQGTARPFAKVPQRPVDPRC